MENKQLEQEHLKAIEESEVDINNFTGASGGSRYEVDKTEAAKANTSITIENMKGFANWISKEYNISDGIGWWHSHDSIEDITTEQLIELYFDSLNKKT